MNQNMVIPSRMGSAQLTVRADGKVPDAQLVMPQPLEPRAMLKLQRWLFEDRRRPHGEAYAVQIGGRGACNDLRKAYSSPENVGRSAFCRRGDRRAPRQRSQRPRGAPKIPQRDRVGQQVSGSPEGYQRVLRATLTEVHINVRP